MLKAILKFLLSLFQKRPVSVSPNGVTAPPNEVITQTVYPNNELVKVAAQYVGVKEVGGDNRGPQVEEFQKATGNGPGDSWCASFAIFCVKQIEQKYGIKSDLFVSGSALTVWNKSPATMRRLLPEAGCIVVWEFGNTAEGHMGIIEEFDPKPETIAHFISIEGNTDAATSLNRNGDGVYRRSRLAYSGSSFKIKGYLRVFPETIMVSKNDTTLA